jgi:hypothetical protein
MGRACLIISFILTSSTIIGYYLLEVNMQKTVKQQGEAKTSSTNLGSGPQFPSSIVCGYHLPLTMETKSGSDVERDSMEPGSKDVPRGFVISGSLDKWRFGGEFTWPEAPHIAFANLLVEDARAVEAFIKRYGVLKESFLDKDPEEAEAAAQLRKLGIAPFKSPPPKTFSIDSTLLEDLQEHLRGAWDNDWSLHKAYVGLVQEQIEFGTAVNVQRPGVVLRTADPWTFICFLFLRDFMSGRLGFCGNPDCPAPYFRKKRKTQKYCEQGPCVQYAQRQYSLDWWNREGKQRREKSKRKLLTKHPK